jgi:hypothetical protein
MRLDVGPLYEDAPECLLGPGSAFAISSQNAEILVAQAWFPGISVAGNTLNPSQQPRHSLMDQLVTRNGDARHSLARCVHFREAGKTAEPMLPFAPIQTGISFWGALLVLGLASTALASGLPAPTTMSVDPPAASLALERYLAGAANSAPWSEPNAVLLEIDASLPGLAERGNLRAIRQWPEVQTPDYRVIRIEGDAMVKQRVIAGYLTAEKEAAARPPSSVALTLANYKFRYLASSGGTPHYAFKITPRHKRTGLIKGELWIDGATGLAVHEAGYLVNRPSIFIRRLKITRDVSLRDGAPYLRTTHLDIDVRFVGRAELAIIESPCVHPISTVIATQESIPAKGQNNECTDSGR